MKTEKQIEITPTVAVRRGLTTRTAVSLALATATILTPAAFLPGVRAADSGKDAKPAIVLVHGAFADGSGWRNIIPLLEKDGYTVTAVQNPLTSLASRTTLARFTQAGVIPTSANAVICEVHRTWNRPDAAQLAELYTMVSPNYRAVMESYAKAQEVAKK